VRECHPTLTGQRFGFGEPPRDPLRVYNEFMSRLERATRIVLAAVGTGIVISLLHGTFWSLSMVWEIALWIVVFAVLSLLNDFLQRRRNAKRV
jgi:hypothetical protein